MASAAASLKRNANVNGNGTFNEQRTWQGLGQGAQREHCLATCHARCCTYLYVYIFLRFINFYISLAAASAVFSPGFYGVNFTTFYAVKVAVNRTVLHGGDEERGKGVTANLSCSKVPLALAYVAHINFHFVASFHWFRTEIE